MFGFEKTLLWSFATFSLIACGGSSKEPVHHDDAGAAKDASTPADGSSGDDAGTTQDGGKSVSDGGEPDDDAGGDAGQHEPQPGVLHVVDDFSAASADYKAVFADLPTSADTPAFYELESGVSALPSPLSGSGFRLKGNNHSDDLWMSVQRRIDGAVANAEYDVALKLTLVSNAGTGCTGIGGAPGESVAVKGGVVGVEPSTHIDNSYYRYSLDIGAQLMVGPDAIDLGNMANGVSCDDPAKWVALARSAERKTPVKADADGHLWFFIGSDSGYEGTSEYWIDRVEVTLTPHK
jgi:hypothetical protein